MSQKMRAKMSNEGCSTIKPDCDPCEVAEDLLADILAQTFEGMEEMEENTSFQAFVEKLKPTFYRHIVKLMDEVAQCFTDGLTGTETWLKKNLSRYHEENAPP